MDRKELLAYLKAGASDQKRPIEFLEKTLLETSDQTIQKSALTGLSKYDDPQALLVLTSRILNSWGMNTLKHAIKLSVDLAFRGGLIVLCSTMFLDQRFWPERFTYLQRYFKKTGDEEALKKLSELYTDRLNLHHNPQAIDVWYNAFLGFQNSDVRNGTIFGIQYTYPPDKRLDSDPVEMCLKPPSHEDIKAASEYVESQIPGINELFDYHLEKRTFSKLSVLRFDHPYKQEKKDWN